VMWGYAGHRGYVVDDLPEDVHTYTTRKVLIPPGLAAVAMAASMIQPLWAEAIYFAMVPVFMMTIRRFEVPWRPFRRNI
jgi:hypothetical protein